MCECGGGLGGGGGGGGGRDWSKEDGDVKLQT